MKISKTVFIQIFLFIIIFPVHLFSDSLFYNDYNKGKEAFSNGLYDRAVTHFENAFAHSTPDIKPILYYWTGQSYMALDNFRKAENIFDNIIKNYKNTPEAVNSLYQKGRIYFNKSYYEKTIEYMHLFLDISGENTLNGNAYFWIAESLFSLGHKDESLIIYNKVIEEYPESYKYEASKYRSELIKLGEREDELMKLLKWSHEESLKERELFIKKEKEYKQAILAYQRKLAVLSDQDINNEVLKLKETNTVLKKQVFVLQSKIERLEKEIDILNKMDNDNKNNEENTADNNISEISKPLNEKQ